MNIKGWSIIGLVALASLATASASVSAGAKHEKLEMYVLEGSAEQIAEAARGLELTDVSYTAAGTRAEAVLTVRQAAKLDARGVKVKFVRNARGRPSPSRRRLMSASGFDVWRSWDEPGGIRDELYEVAQANPDLVKLEVLGADAPGPRDHRPARDQPQAARASARRSGRRCCTRRLQHAREWISAEVNRRTLHYFIDQYRAATRRSAASSSNTELWFVLVANPDGYQYTFDVDRLWRKNLRDNDNNGQVTVGDGVDPNRNFADHWGYDDEGSSNEPASETYRGPSAASEPETQAMQGLIDRVTPKFHVQPALVRPWLLYPQGWQIGHARTPTTPSTSRSAGTDANPAIPGFNPGQSARHALRHQRRDDRLRRQPGARSRSRPSWAKGSRRRVRLPRRRGAGPGRVREDPRLPSRARPVGGGSRRPVSPVGITVRAVLPRPGRARPAERRAVAVRLHVRESYGDPQEVRVLAKRSLGTVTLRYRINGGAASKRADE